MEEPSRQIANKQQRLNATKWRESSESSPLSSAIKRVQCAIEAAIERVENERIRYAVCSSDAAFMGLLLWAVKRCTMLRAGQCLLFRVRQPGVFLA